MAAYDAVAQQAVMAVAGVGIESDVAEYPDLRHSLLDGPDGTTHQIVRIERLASVLVTALRVGVGKERETGNGKLGGTLGLSHGLVDREPLDARHRVDRHARLRSFGEEQRPNQIMRGHGVLTHEAPRPLRLAVAARALDEIETGLALDLGLDRGETGFDGAAVFDGHCGAPGEDGSFSRSATHTPAGLPWRSSIIAPLRPRV